MDILGHARRLESKIARALDGVAHRAAGTGAREPLAIAHAIVEAIEREVQPAGRGRHVFPFNRLTLSVVAPSDEARARLEAVFDGETPLRDRIVDRLKSAGCDVPSLTVEVVYVPETGSQWANRDFHLQFARVTGADEASPPSARSAALELTIVHGSAEQAGYAFTLARVDLGRCAEVRDGRNRLIRTNHVAFADGAGDLNQSVSRRHAHIEYAAGSGHYRVYDDRSAHGTGVLRNGLTITVYPGSRGVRLESGDEIVLGEARVRVRIG
ncbi:MAG: FHA domain-containing protein [Acidobacteriota bacterium]